MHERKFAPSDRHERMFLAEMHRFAGQGRQACVSVQLPVVGTKQIEVLAGQIEEVGLQESFVKWEKLSAKYHILTST